MKTSTLFAALCALLLLAWAVMPAHAQYDLTPDTAETATDSVKAKPDSVKADSANADSEETEKPRSKLLQSDDDIPAQDTSIPAAGAPAEGVVSDASLWLRRLLYRGTLDATEIGAYAKYQITSWDEKVGSYGPVEARMTVYYLGTSEWMGRDAEWMQAVYQTVEGEPTTVEFDLIVPSSSVIKTIYRALYRVDGGEAKTISLAPPGDALDYDALDHPASEGEDLIKLYSGTYNVEKFRGSGQNGSKVIMYRSKTVPPLDLVRLGYGEQGLTVTGTGSDAAPRWDVPPPPSVGNKE